VIAELHTVDATIRIPEQRSVPLTRRVLRIVDHPDMQRLRRVRQLGPIHLVYPGAVHTRFEHSLGVYDMTRQYLVSLLRSPELARWLEPADVECALLAGLLHDLGHYPFAHSLEAVHLPGRDTPRHEDLMGRILLGSLRLQADVPPIAELIRRHFEVSPEDVVALVTRRPASHLRPQRRLMASILSSGVDADKADYLERDSVHMGVSYGRHYDRGRFLDALCVHPAGDRIALTDKGRVSAEIFIFTRYTMFSEAYWHHSVRAISAMVERALADFRAQRPELDDGLTERLLAASDDELLAWIRAEARPESVADRLLRGLTDGRRDFFRRVLSLNRARDERVIQQAYDRIYGLDAWALERLHFRLRQVLADLVGREVLDWEILIDTPPRDKDRVEAVDLVYEHGGRRRAVPLEQTSRVVQGIGSDFVKVVKKIRVFVAPGLRAELARADALDHVGDRLLDAILAFRPEPDAQRSLFDLD
jgi:HD superfamily phosphohydrolase